MTAVRTAYLEIGRDARVSEGRVGVAATHAPPESSAHPNGALGLTDLVLSVPGGELAAHTERYSAILDREPQGGVFELDEGARLRIVPGAVDALGAAIVFAQG